MNKFLLQIDLGSYTIEKNINVDGSPLIKKEHNEKATLLLYGSYTRNIDVNALFVNLLAANEDIDNILKTLDGDFLLIFINKEKKQIILANDKNAKYRLYYSIEDLLLTISNQTFLHAAHMDKVRLSQRGVFQILSSNYLFDPQTLLEGVKVIPVGAYTKIENRKPDVRFYYKTVQIDAPEYGTEEETIAELDKSLTEVFEKRIEERGEPVILLSGGIDSLAMVHYLKSVRQSKVHSLTFGLSNVLNDDQRASHKAAKYYNLAHQELNINPSNSWSLFTEGLYQSDAFTYSNIITTAIRKSFDNDQNYVLFTGQDTRLHTPGLDFGSIAGIKKNILNEEFNVTEKVLFHTAKLLKNWPLRGKGTIRAFLEKTKSYQLPNQYIDKLIQKAIHFSPESRISFKRDYYLPPKFEMDRFDTIKDVFKSMVWVSYHSQYTDNMNEQASAIETQCLRLDFPFYDSNFVEVCNRIPFESSIKPIYSFKTGSLMPVSRKYFLRKLLEGKVPDSLLWRRKATPFTAQKMINQSFHDNIKLLLTNYRGDLLDMTKEGMAHQLLRDRIASILSLNSPQEHTLYTFKGLFILVYLIALTQIMKEKNFNILSKMTELND